MQKATQALAFRKAARAAVKPTWMTIVRAAPVADKPYQLKKGQTLIPSFMKRNIKLGVSGKRHNVGARIYLTKPAYRAYKYVAKGAKPHEIRPKDDGSLFFNGRHFESVKHKGYRPNPFITRIFGRQQKKVVDELALQLQKQIRKAVK